MKTAIIAIGIAILAMASSKSFELQGPQVFFTDSLDLELPGNQVSPLPVSSQRQKAGRCKCGQRQVGRIIGGEDASPGEFPWRVRVATTYNDGNTFSCGGTILSATWVLTAAHCLVDDMGLKVTRIEVFYGDVDYFSKNKARVQRFIPHEQYTGAAGAYNDIALLQLRDAIPLDDPQVPAGPGCLPYKLQGRELSGQVLASGWGRTDGNNPNSVSRTLKKAVVDLAPWCFTKLWRVTEKQVCTDSNIGGKGTCEGDSGGSIDVQIGDNFYAYGIVSYGKTKNCSGLEVYTRVSSYLDWIEENSGETFCKL